MPLLLAMEAVMPHRTLLNIKERVERAGKAGLEELKTGDPFPSRKRSLAALVAS